MSYTFLFIICLFFSFNFFAQDLSSSKKIVSTVSPVSNVFTTIEDLEKNGIKSSKIKTKISSDDIERLGVFDFSGYRNYSESQLVQIKNGPIIELYSIEKSISKGMVFKDSLINEKLNINNSGVTHSVIPLVEIGFGIKLIEPLH